MQPETEYFYRICSINRGGNSDYSNIASAVTHAQEVFLISYDNGNLENFLTIPDMWGFGDSNFNVRFTPPFAPFYIIETHIGLFNLENHGNPDMEVILWQSGEIDGEPGYPVEVIDNIVIANEDLIFSDADDIQFNIIDLTELRIGINDEIDFHIGVNIVSEDEEDTLSVLIDDGRANQTRSVFWAGNMDQWVKMDSDEGFGENFNFAIRAVITDENPFGNGLRPVRPNYHPGNVAIIYPSRLNGSNQKTINFGGEVIQRRVRSIR